MTTTIRTTFVKKIKYQVEVSVPDEATVVYEHGTPYIETIDYRVPGMKVLLSLQAAYRKGLVQLLRARQ